MRPARRLAALLAASALSLSACAHRNDEKAIAKATYETQLTDVDGIPFDLGQLKGKVALVTFFATWCFPCMLEVPTLEKLQGTYGKEGFQVVAIGMDREGVKVLKPFARTLKTAPYVVLVADADMLEGRTPYGTVQTIPVSYLLGRDGKVQLVWEGVLPPELIEKKVKSLLE